MRDLPADERAGAEKEDDHAQADRAQQGPFGGCGAIDPDPEHDEKRDHSGDEAAGEQGGE